MPLVIQPNTQLEIWAMGKARLILQIIAHDIQGESVKKGTEFRFDSYGAVLHHESWEHTQVTAVQRALGKLGYDVLVKMENEYEPYVRVVFNKEYSFEISAKTLKFAEACAKEIWDWINREYAGLTLPDGFKISIQAGTLIVNIPQMVQTPGILQALNQKFAEKYGFTFNSIEFKGRKGVSGHDLVLVV